MPNFTAVLAFPIRGNTFFLDQVTVTKPATPRGIARGYLTPDYNVKLRGTQRRIDVNKPTT